MPGPPVLLSVARAFQPEVCPSAPGGQPLGYDRRLQLWWLTRSREVAKGNAQVRCSVFGGYWLLAIGYWLLAIGYWLLGEPRTGVRGCCCQTDGLTKGDIKKTSPVNFLRSALYGRDAILAGPLSGCRGLLLTVFSRRDAGSCRRSRRRRHSAVRLPHSPNGGWRGNRLEHRLR